MRAPEQQTAANCGRNQRHRCLADAAIEEAAHQPFEAVVEGEWRGCEGEQEARRRACGECDRQAGEQQNRGIGAPAGKGDDDDQCENAPTAPLAAKAQRLVSAQPVGGENRAERAAAAAAGDVGRGERIGEKRLQGCARHAENCSVAERQRACAAGGAR